MGIKKFIVICLVMITALSCNKTKNHPIPNIQFDTEINLSLPSYQDLQGVGGYAYALGGVKGIIIYRKSQSEFVCFDRMATTDNAADCDTGLEVNEDNFLILDDPCSSAQYSLYDGSIVQGDVEFGLRKYITQWDGNLKLRIYNY